MFKGFKLAALSLLAAALCSPAAQAQTTTPTVRKFNPGHYTVLLWSNRDQRYMDEAARQPGTRGIMKKYRWKELEPTQGSYNFSMIQSDLNWAQAYGMQLIIMIEDKTFKLERPNPTYLDSLTPRNRAGGYTMLRFHPTIVTRYKALTTAIGKRFDTHPNFEGIAQQETALGLDGPVLQQFGYTPEKYRDALISSFTHALTVMPRSRVFWYQNYLVGNQAYIGAVAAATGPKGLVMAGPDVLPDKKSLVDKSYPYFEQYKDKMHMGIQVEDICYRHLHATAGYATKYWTMTEIYFFAKNDMHANYMFWVRLPVATPADSNDYYDALPVIAKYPVIN